MTDTPTRSYDDLDPITAVIRAWTDPWPNMDWRELCMQDIRETNAALATALDRLVEMSGSVDSILGRLGRTIDAVTVPPTEMERRDLANAHRDEVVEGSGVPIEPRKLGTVAPEEVVILDDDGAAEFITLDGRRTALVTLPDVDDSEFDPTDKTIEEIGARGREASLRLQAWGRRGAYREAAEREANLRTRLILNLYHRDGVTQHQIAEMLGISSWRITQILNVHYERLRDEESARRGRKAS